MKSALTKERRPNAIVPYVRWMIRRDMPEVIDIENRSYDNPWAEETFLRCLRERNCIGMVAEIKERVVGYMIYDLHKGSLDLRNLTVAPTERLCGVGRAMVEKLIGKLCPFRRSCLTITVRESNLDGQLFLRACGLRCTNVLRNFYGSDEDAYTFVRDVRVQEMAMH